jgi:ubiquinone/menaquinone biosynthesis C-methylase UbiE
LHAIGCRGYGLEAFMSESTLQAQIEAAAAYERLFVPALFQQWSARLIEAADVKPGDRVLDVACGTGVLAREVVSFVGPHGSVAGIDPNPRMLAIAEQQFPAAEWHCGMAEALPYSDESFSAVVSQFGLMFFTDRSQALREMLRVLAPGGRLVLAVWDDLDNNPAYRDLVRILEEMAGTPAAETLRAPFALGDQKELRKLAVSTGMTNPSITRQGGTARFPNLQAMVEAELRGWLPLAGIDLSENKIVEIIAAAELGMRAYVSPNGAVVFPLSAHFMVERKAER